MPLDMTRRALRLADLARERRRLGVKLRLAMGVAFVAIDCIQFGDIVIGVFPVYTILPQNK